MEGKPTGITYSRQMASPQTGRPMQPARPVAASPTPETATAPQIRNVGATPYWSPARAWLVGALVACALTPSIFGLATYIFIGPFLAPTILALVLILVKGRPWAYLTSLILGVLFPIMVVVMISGGDFNPLDRSGYLATTTNLAAIPVITVAGIIGFRTSRPNAAAPLRRGMRAGVSVFSTIVVAMLVGSFISSYAAHHHALSGSTGGGYDVVPEATTSVVAQDFVFNPTDVNVPVNKYTEIVIQNLDAEGHTFTYKNAGVEYNHELLGGQTIKVLVFFATAGSYQFWCVPHSNGEGDTDPHSMIGEIVVA